MPPWLVIGVSGVTCGGKTTLAYRLRDYFQQVRGAQLWNTPYVVGEVQLISQDDYFLPVDDLRHEWNDKLNAINFELLSSLDMKKMLSDVACTMTGRFANKASDPLDNMDLINEMSMNTHFEHYDQPISQPQQQLYQPNHYKAQQQRHQCQSHQNQQHNQISNHHQHKNQHTSSQQHHTQSHIKTNIGHSSSHSANIMRVNSQMATELRENKMNFLIIEGFTIFNQPELLTLCNIKFHFHLPYEKCYQRRQKRTYDPPDVTGYFEVCVWPHYEKNFNEIRDRPDVTFLNGELSKERLFKFVLQKIANYFEERSELACPPPQKLLGIPSYLPSANMHNENWVGVGGGGGSSRRLLSVGGLSRTSTNTVPWSNSELLNICEEAYKNSVTNKLPCKKGCCRANAQTGFNFSFTKSILDKTSYLYSMHYDKQFVP